MIPSCATQVGQSNNTGAIFALKTNSWRVIKKRRLGPKRTCLTLPRHLIAMASNPITMACNLRAMACNLIAMASHLRGMASSKGSLGPKRTCFALHSAYLFAALGVFLTFCPLCRVLQQWSQRDHFEVAAWCTDTAAHSDKCTADAGAFSMLSCEIDSMFSLCCLTASFAAPASDKLSHHF